MPRQCAAYSLGYGAAGTDRRTDARLPYGGGIIITKVNAKIKLITGYHLRYITSLTIRWTSPLLVYLVQKASAHSDTRRSTEV